MEPTYYRVSVTKATYVECWRATRSFFEFVVVSLFKTLRMSALGAYATTNDGFERVNWDELRDDVRRSLQSIRSEMELIGYRYCFCFGYPSIGAMSSTTMIMLAPDSNSWVTVLCERHQVGNYVNNVVATFVRSELSNGNFLFTCDLQNPYPEGIICERRPKYSAPRLAERHQERLAEVSPAYPISLSDEFALERRVRDLEDRIFQYGIEREMLIPLTDVEFAKFAASSTSTDATLPVPAILDQSSPADSNDNRLVELSDEHLLSDEYVYDALPADVVSEAPASRYPGVMAELENIRNKKGSWISGAVILGISIAVFLAAGAARWNWSFALMLIPVLLFHELGHFVAMRVFKYRNVKMFFIPLLGAAVTGQNYNVAGWKKAIVSLAGPVPGILVGGVLGIVAAVNGDEGLLLEAAQLTIILNAFNLLPFLPLDGGWIVHVLLFSRHHVLDTTFRAIAAGVLILSGLLGLRFLMFIGIMMLLGLRSAHRVARVASEIRDANIDTSSPDGQHIPVETADAIISRLDAVAPAQVPDRLRAQQTLQVFETVNARPPDVLGTLALLGVHAGSFVAAFVFLIIMEFIQNPDAWDIAAP